MIWLLILGGYCLTAWLFPRVALSLFALLFLFVGHLELLHGAIVRSIVAYAGAAFFAWAVVDLEPPPEHSELPVPPS